MICRMYKALTAFAACGFVATICALILDVSVKRKSRERGAYNSMGGEKKTIGIRQSEPHMGGHELRDFGESWERRSHEGARTYKVQRPIEAKQFGYDAPLEQTSYG